MFQLDGLKKSEKATLAYSYVGEFGRGVFTALRLEFALVIAVSRFGVDDRLLIWGLSSASFAGFILSFSNATLNERWRKKTVVRVFEVLSRLLLIPAAVAPNGTIFVTVMVVAILMDSAVMPLVNGIYGVNFGREVRGAAVGRLQAMRVGSTAAAAALLGRTVELSPQGFRVLLGAFALLSLGCALYSYGVPETRRAQQSGPGTGRQDCFAILRGDHAFMYLQLCWFILGISNLCLNPLRVLHLRDLGFSDGRIMMLTTTTSFTVMVLSVGAWGRVLYRMNFAVYRGVTLVLLILGIGVFFRGRTPAVIAAGSALWALGLAGGGLSWRLVGTFFCGRDKLPAYMSVHTALCGLRGIIGPFVTLRLYGVLATSTIVSAAVGGLTLALVMLVPFKGMLDRRMAEPAGESDPECA